VLGLQVGEHFPEKLFRQGAVALFVRVAERVTRGRSRSAHRPECRHLESQGITHVVESKGVADLRIEHRHHVTPRAERAGLVRGAGLPGEFRDQVGWNQFDELPQHGSVPVARLLCFFFFFTPAFWQVSKNQSTRPPFPFRLNQPPLWDGCDGI